MESSKIELIDNMIIFTTPSGETFTSVQDSPEEAKELFDEIIEGNKEYYDIIEVTEILKNKN